MSDSRKYFGTDGIRGRVGEFPITPDFILRLGWAAGCVLTKKHHNNKLVLIGKDTRISGYMLESALEAGLSAAGMNIGLVGPLPTPAIAYLTKTLRAEAGIVISASHNPHYDNGIKFFSNLGYKLPDAVEKEIEMQLETPLTTVSSEQLGKANRIMDASVRYTEFCKSVIPPTMLLKGLTIVLDCANGATYQVAPRVFRELGANVLELAVNPDGLNINNYCGATQTQMLQKIVKAEQADVGIAFDGDGDRLMMVDHQGELVDGDELLFIMAKHLQTNDALTGGVVGTVMTNLGLELALRDLGIDFVRTNVGDRYVMESLLKHHWKLGGETSGHIIDLNLTTTGDGIIAALRLLLIMLLTQKTLQELKSGLEKFPQILLNIKLAGHSLLNAKILQANTTIQKALQHAIKQVDNRGRVLLRPSGTEPLVRVMVEGEDEDLIKTIAQDLAEVVRTAL